MAKTPKQKVVQPNFVHASVVTPKPKGLPSHFRYEEMREGAHDYRKIPSLMGGERVPYCGMRGRTAEVPGN